MNRFKISLQVILLSQSALSSYDFIKNEIDEWLVYRKIRVGKISYSAYTTLLLNIGTASNATIELKKLFKDKVFDTPKPETLIQHLIYISTNENELVLDSFGGSGTVASVAHKMNRDWILIEIGSHADTVIIPRMVKVLNGEDQSGISKAVHWKGGGSFSYYHLGQSIISINKKGEPDFNWKLGRVELEKSLLLTYDFIPLESGASIHQPKKAGTQQPDSLQKDARTQRPNLLYTIGYKTKNGKRIAGVCSLSEEPTLSNEKGEIVEPGEFMSYMEFMGLLKKIEKVDFIYFYTNRGVEVSSNEIPENLEIVKVPSSIFQELED